MFEKSEEKIIVISNRNDNFFIDYNLSAKDKRSGIKNAFLRKLRIPKSSEEFKEMTRRKKNVEKC